MTNMSGTVPRTSTLALNNATLPFAIALTDKGYHKALLDDPHLMNGLNVYRDYITHADVAKDLRQSFTPALKLLH